MMEMQVHPVAALFPMLAEDELASMAADIRERGLIQPITLDGEGRILDGRNRQAACERAGVEPRYETYQGEDPAGYALAVNIQRRSLTKGQAAMVAAKAIETIGSQHGAKAKAARSIGVSAMRISQAALVLKYASGLADAVVAGATSLDDAYAEARRRKTEDQGDEARLATLRASRPDLADKVTDGELSLTEAIAAWQAAERREAEERRDALALLTRIVDLAAPTTRSAGFIESWAAHLGEVDPDMVKRIEEAAQVLMDLAERITS